MNIKKNILTLLLLASPIACQENMQPTDATQEIQIPEETAKVLTLMYTRFMAEYESLKLYILSQENIDTIYSRHNKDQLITKLNKYFNDIIVNHKYMANIKENAKKISSMLEKTMKNKSIDEKKITMLQAEQFIYLNEIINEISKFYLELLKEGEKSIQECDDIKRILIHSLVMI